MGKNANVDEDGPISHKTTSLLSFYHPYLPWPLSLNKEMSCLGSISSDRGWMLQNDVVNPASVETVKQFWDAMIESPDSNDQGMS